MKLEWKTCFKVGASIFLLYLAIINWEKVADFVAVLFGAAMPLIIGAGIDYIVNYYILSKSIDKILFK